MMKKILISGLEAAYLDEGEGETVIFVHCSSASHKEWLPVSSQLSGQYRVLIPDLAGYGASSVWESDNGLDIRVDLNFIDRLLEEATAPVHIIAHSYGGALGLEASAAHFSNGGEKIKSLLLIEPVAFHLLKDAKTEHEAEVLSIAHKTSSAAADGDLELSASIYMGFWLGEEAWRSSPDRFRNEVIRTMPKVAAEFEGIEALSSNTGTYAAITCPVTLVQGGLSPKPALAVMGVLKGLLPNVSMKELPGAGHMSPFSHTEQVSEIIKTHLKEQS